MTIPPLTPKTALPHGERGKSRGPSNLQQAREQTLRAWSAEADTLVSRRQFRSRPLTGREQARVPVARSVCRRQGRLAFERCLLLCADLLAGGRNYDTARPFTYTLHAAIVMGGRTLIRCTAVGIRRETGRTP